MNKIITLLLTLTIFTLSLEAYDIATNKSIAKYKQIKKDNYLKKLIDKREVMSSKRDAKDILRQYQTLKLARR